MLKDEDLRKKYDMYGEDGLKEGGPTGRNYQSWSFYNQEFGMLCFDHKLNFTCLPIVLHAVRLAIVMIVDNVVCCLSICVCLSVCDAVHCG